MMHLFSPANESAPMTPGEIVAAVPKSQRQLNAEKALKALRRVRDDLIRQARAVAAERMPGTFRRVPTDREREIARLQQENAAALVLAVKEEAAARADYEDRVRLALAPLTAKAVAGFREALDTLLEEWESLDEVDAALRTAGMRLDNNMTPRMTAVQFRIVTAKFVAGAVQL